MGFDFTKILKREHSHKWAAMTKKGVQPDQIVPFTVADYDFEMLDVIKDALHRAVEEMPMGYTYGSPSYYDSIVNFIKRHHDYDIKRHDILESTGVVASIDEMIKVFTKENDEILVFTPVYTPFMKTIEKNDRVCIEAVLHYDKQYSIDFNELENLLQTHSIKMVLLCSPHNPVGRVWTKDELTQLSTLFLKYDVLIVSDEIHGQIIMKPHKQIMMASLSKEIEAKTITLISPTKTFNLAGLHVSSILVTGDLKRQIINYRKKTSFGGLNVLARVACEAAFTHGDDYIEEFNDLIKENHLLLKNFIEQNIPEIKVIDLEGTYLQWLDFSEFGLSEDELKDILEDEHSLFFNQGKVYGVKEGVFFRWNLAYPTSYIKEGLLRLQEWNVSRETK